MKNYIVTIETWYSTEEYLIPIDTESKEWDFIQIDKAFASIGFCDAFEVVKMEEVTAEYMEKREELIRRWEQINGESIEEGFCSGKFVTLECLENELEGK